MKKINTTNTTATTQNQSPEPNKPKKKGKKKWLLIVIAIIIVLLAFSNDSKDETKSVEKTSSIETSLEQPDMNQENKAETEVTQAAEVTATTEEDNIPKEYKSALKKAKTYSDIMHMSKAAIYNQLTSEYGDKFTVEAAKYAIDNVDADWSANALESAKLYQEDMNMSHAAIHDQLTSEYGDKFTQEEADYAIENLDK